MATYGKLRETTILGQAGTTWYVELWEKDFTGTTNGMTLEGEGFSVKWSGEGGTRDRQFVNSECVLNMMIQNSTDEALMYKIFSEGDRNYYIRIYKNSQAKADIWWFGWVNPSFSKLENHPFPYVSNIKSSDSLGTFSKRKEDELSNLNYISIDRINSHIKDFGDTMGVYNSPTELITDGDFPFGTTEWSYGSSWTIPTGGGQIDFDGGSGAITQTGVSITQGEDVSFSFTIKNLTEGESISIALANQSGTHLLSAGYVTYTSNGNYIIQGEALQNATDIKIFPGSTGDTTFSFTDASIIDGLITNQSPCPTNNNWFQTSIDWWRDGDVYQSDDPFYLYRTTKTAYRDNPKEKPLNYRQYDVLKGALKTFNTTCVLSEGKYNFIQPNSWLEGTSGVLPFYKYNVGGDFRETSSDDIDNLLNINGGVTDSSGAIMNGASITYEPPLKEVTATFGNTFEVVNIPNNQDITTELSLGYLDSSVGNLEFKIVGTRKEVMLSTDVETELGPGFDLSNWLIQLKLDVTIKLTNGIDTYYLDWLGVSTSGEWVSSNLPTYIYSGFGSWASEAGGTYESNPNAIYPTRVSEIGNNYEAFSHFIKTIQTSSAPPISGDLSIISTGNNYYKKYNEFVFQPIQEFTTPTLLSESTELSLESGVRSINNNQADTNTVGVEFSSTHDGDLAEESFDLGDVVIGALTDDSTATFGDSLSQFNVAYQDSGNVLRFASEGFRRGGSGSYSNITQLLCNEFLEPQIEPLEILQASVFSSNISPVKLLKYSINNDSNYKYYTFLGGTFNAQSETMEGEWFKVNQSSLFVITENPLILKYKKESVLDKDKLLLSNDKTKQSVLVLNNGLGSLDTIIPFNTPTTTISLSGNIKGNIAKGQKLTLTHSDGSQPIEVVADAEYKTLVTDVKVVSFSPNVEYPVGSVLSLATYDITSTIFNSSSTPAPQTDKIDLTVAQYNSLHVTPIKLASAPGVGKVIIPISITIYANHSVTELAAANLYTGFNPLSTVAGNYYAYIKRFMQGETGDRMYSFDYALGEIAQGSTENMHFAIYSNLPLVGAIKPTVYFTYQIMDI